jgi:hypothetical protein
MDKIKSNGATTLTLSKGVEAYLIAVDRIPPPQVPGRRPRATALTPLVRARHRGRPRAALGHVVAGVAVLTDLELWERTPRATTSCRRPSGLAGV